MRETRWGADRPAGAARPGVFAGVALALAALLIVWQSARASVLEWQRAAARDPATRRVVLSGSHEERVALVGPAFVGLELARDVVPRRSGVVIVADPDVVATASAEIVAALHPRGVEFVPALLPEYVQPLRRRGGWMLVDAADAEMLSGITEEVHARDQWRLVRIRSVERR